MVGNRQRDGSAMTRSHVALLIVALAFGRCSYEAGLRKAVQDESSRAIQHMMTQLLQAQAEGEDAEVASKRADVLL